MLLGKTFINGTLSVEKSRDLRIFAQSKASRRLLLESLLNTLQTQGPVDRFSYVLQDERLTQAQIYWFYTFFQWFALIAMIVAIMLGVGILFE